MFCICRCSVLSSVISLLFTFHTTSAPFSTTSAPFRSREITVSECKGVDSRFIIRTKIFFFITNYHAKCRSKTENKKGARTTKNWRTFCKGLLGGAFAGDGTISNLRWKSLKTAFSASFINHRKVPAKSTLLQTFQTSLHRQTRPFRWND